jgi:hypothetical protein
VGTEIRTFYSLKEMAEYVTDQINEYKSLYEDYSQWLGSLLRDSDDPGKLAALKRDMQSSAKKNQATKQVQKKTQDRSKNEQGSHWIEVGGTMLCSTEQGEAEILFEAIEEINRKTQSLEKFKSALQQIERIGPGKSVNYVTYIKDDIPDKIVIKSKITGQTDENFNFAAEFTAQGLEH